MRTSFVFYESFYDAISDLNQQQQAKIYNAICRYAFFGEEPELTGALSTVFKLIRPQIDANNKKFENGKKGGRPVKSTGSEVEEKQEKTKIKPSNNQNKPNNNQTAKNHNPMSNDNDNDNVNEKCEMSNVNANDNDNDNGAGSGPVVVVPKNNSNDFDLFKQLGCDGIDAIYDVYPESGGFLIDEVQNEIKRMRRTVRDPVRYVLGYAKNVKWDDNANHFEGAP